MNDAHTFLLGKTILTEFVVAPYTDLCTVYTNGFFRATSWAPDQLSRWRRSSEGIIYVLHGHIVRGKWYASERYLWLKARSEKDCFSKKINDALADLYAERILLGWNPILNKGTNKK